jgi:uncharacterized coiled-coil protein SlyX
MARENTDSSAAVTAIPSTAEQDHETEPEITEIFERRATLPPDHDPARVAELDKLLAITSKKAFEKVNIETQWEGMKQAKMAFVQWEIHANEQDKQIAEMDKQITELQAELANKDTAINVLSKQVSSRHVLSAKHPDPDPLEDNTDPEYEHWKLEMEGKFERNADHFKNENERMIYVYGRTKGDAKRHLTPQYKSKSFETAEEMIEYLGTVYEDQHREENARNEYRELVMKSTQSFPEFYTKFTQLAGEAQIPKRDLRPDLYFKLSFDLKKLILPTYGSLKTLVQLKDQCLLLDQENRRLKEQMSRFQSRKNASIVAYTPTPRQDSSSANHPKLASGSSNQFTRVRPQYDDPARKALSIAGKCFRCEQAGHFSRDCPVKKEVNVVEEAGKDQP